MSREGIRETKANAGDSASEFFTRLHASFGGHSPEVGKPDVTGTTSGTAYAYSSVHPHAVASAFGYAMTYDLNGNLLTRTKTGDNSYVKWAGFDKPRWLYRQTQVGTSGPLVRGSEFHYNAVRPRVMQLEFDSVTGTVPNQTPSH